MWLVKEREKRDSCLGMLTHDQILPFIKQLIDVGRFFHTRNWAPATSGNYSCRLTDELILLTASGAHKGELSEDTFVVVNNEGEKDAAWSTEGRPSAETQLHTQLYGLDSEIGAVLHSHSVASTVISRHSKNEVVFDGYEMQKAFSGVTTHECQVVIPVFENSQDMNELSAVVAEYVSAHGMPAAYLIRGHGAYAWGKTLFEARRHIEAVEFLLECEWKHSQLKKG